MKHGFYPHAVSIILLARQCRTAKMCFLQSWGIWISCGPTDCAGFVLHEGILTVCSGGRYLNLGDIHMGGKGRKWKWSPHTFLHGERQIEWRLHVDAKTELNWVAQYMCEINFLVQHISFCHFHSIPPLLLAHCCLQLLTIQLYVNIDLDICLPREEL